MHRNGVDLIRRDRVRKHNYMKYETSKGDGAVEQVTRRILYDIR